MEEIINKYFSYDGQTLEFTASDSYNTEYGSPVLTWSKFRGNPNKIVIWIQTRVYDEPTPVKLCTSPEQLEAFIKALIF